MSKICHLLSKECFVNNMSMAMLKEVASLKNPAIFCLDKVEEMSQFKKCITI